MKTLVEANVPCEIVVLAHWLCIDESIPSRVAFSSLLFTTPNLDHIWSICGQTLWAVVILVRGKVLSTSI